MSTGEPSQTSDLRRDNESNKSSSIDVETLSLEAESFISFKSKRSDSTVKSSIASLTESISKMSVTSSLKQKKDRIITSVKNRLKDFNKKMHQTFDKGFQDFVSKDKERKLEENFLGYYECLIPSNSELSIPKISLTTARIDLHETKTQEPEKAKYLVLTKIKESPYINNSSLFIITGKGSKIENGGWTGKKFNEFPQWMQNDSIKDLIVENPVKGLGTYRVLIKNIENTDNEGNIYKNINLKELEEIAEKEDGFNYKMLLAGYYIMGTNDLKTANLHPAEEMYKNATEWYRKAEKSGSVEAKLCLGYMHCIGFSMLDYNPETAKKLFKEVIKANAVSEKTNSSKETTSEELARIAMRNIAILYHNSYVIKPFEWKNIIKDSQSAYNLGLLYEDKDGIKAEKWFEKA
ncbi:1289_t:CDS:2, partial [Funneliformis mosseae]